MLSDGQLFERDEMYTFQPIYSPRFAMVRQLRPVQREYNE
jgi:hypothetical protein